MKKMFTTRRILLLIVLLGALLRLHGINWDQGFHLHPDERAIIMAVDKLQFPTSLAQFLDPNSPWNPKFFAYGSFPMYLLQFAGNLMGNANTLYAEYAQINLVGRVISAFFDIGTVLLLFFIGRLLFNRTTGLVAAFLYAISVLPVQLSHFYAVDTILTFFTTASLYMLMKFYIKPSLKTALLIGLTFGLALATKVSAIVLIASIGVVLVIDFVLAFSQYPRKPKRYMPQLKNTFKNVLTYGVAILAIALATFILFEPYAAIDNKTFWEQTMYQSMMTKDAFVFPYTLQYVGKIPYLYEIQNIFLYGLGPVLGIICFLGFGYMIVVASRKEKLFALSSPLFAFLVVYFWVVGGFAIGFMRYMLPVYPLLCLFGALLFFKSYEIFNKYVKNTSLFFTVALTFLIVLLIWPLSFVQIYSGNNTRYDATNWIHENIPPGAAVAIEHWDDGLPLVGQERYVIITLGLYEPDTPVKWDIVTSQLEMTDYIIIASNRLYTPLQKLTDCANLPPMKCYPQTASYYYKLFNGELGFEKVAEFSDYPTVPLLNMPINDQNADESFTVYDHPKVTIFKKTQPLRL